MITYLISENGCNRKLKNVIKQDRYNYVFKKHRRITTKGIIQYNSNKKHYMETDRAGWDIKKSRTVSL